MVQSISDRSGGFYYCHAPAALTPVKGPDTHRTVGQVSHGDGLVKVKIKVSHNRPR